MAVASDRLSITPEEVDQKLLSLGVDRNEKVAVAVSGGVDSMCLALLVSEIRPTVCLTVDHGLRTESAEEADFVKKTFASKGLQHETLVWEGVKPSGNIQAIARLARYTLMEEWCVANGVRYILLGHHKNDQAETFLLRLNRGSGVYGLSGMAEITKGAVKSETISIVRPFLGYTRDRIENTMKSYLQSWVDDPSNSDVSFDRIKARKLLADPPLSGLNVDRLAATADNMRRARTALEHYTIEFLAKAVSFDELGFVSFKASDFSNVPDEIAYRALALIIQFASGSAYSPRFRSLEPLLGGLKGGGFAGCTLSGAHFVTTENDRVIVCRELAAMPERQPVTEVMYDHRYRVEAGMTAKSMDIGPLGKDGWETISGFGIVSEKLQEMPYPLRIVQPAIFDGDDVCAVPLVGINAPHRTAPDVKITPALKWPVRQK